MVDRKREFSSAEVQRSSELTYRQINDWDSRGALPNSRSSDRGWRQFSAREIFIVMVCAEMRKRFGVPIKRTDFVRECMLQEGADHLRAAIDLMAILGVGVWIMTDLEKSFVMDSELEFQTLWEMGYFGQAASPGYIFVKVNPLVNRLLKALDHEGIEEHGRGYEIVRMLRDRSTVSSEGEVDVLEAIRSGDFDKIEITLDNGEVKTIRTTEHRSLPSQLGEILREHAYQKITVQKRDGEIVSIEQVVTSRVRNG